MIMLDTCALLWWTLDSDKLSPRAAKACRGINSHGAVISSMTIWEMGMKIKKGNLDVGMSLVDYVKKLKKMNILNILPVDDITWMKNIDLKWKHRDPVDRTIVATAILKKMAIVTSDVEIRKFYKKTIW